MNNAIPLTITGSVTSVAVTNQALGSLISIRQIVSFLLMRACNIIAPGLMAMQDWMWVHLTLSLHRKSLPRLCPVRVSVANTLYRLTWGYLKLQGHIEYAQQMNDDGSLRVGYAALCTE